MSKVNVGILGASGYGGAGLLRRLARHPNANVTAVGSRQYLGKKVEAAWPQLAGFYPDLIYTDSTETIKNCDVIFCATPHGATAPLVAEARNAGKQVIDLSADFRLPIELYETWYSKHPYPELYSQARYGLIELHRQELKDLNLIAVPGCNSSCAILALAPLGFNKLLGEDIICNIITGVTGAGRGTSLALHYGEANENAKPYKVAGTHRHVAEIEMTLGRIQAMGRQLSTHESFDPVMVAFNPHLVPMSRGILASCYTKPSSSQNLSNKYLLELFRDFYKHDPLIYVQENLPETKAVQGTDRTLISVRFDERSNQIIAFAAIDNLGKGAAGQAIQNFNLNNGFEETLALEQNGLWP